MVKLRVLESGRSMIEILGVLSLVGILSVGSLEGYRYAIEKYVANEIVNALHERGTDIFHRYQVAPLPEGDVDKDVLTHAFEEWDTQIQTGHFAIITSNPEFDGFKIWVDNVEAGVCEKILDMGLLDDENMPGLQMIHVNGVRFERDNSICGKEASQMEFSYLLDANATVTDCLVDETCQSVCAEMECRKDREYTCGCPDTGDGYPQICNPETRQCEAVRRCEMGREFRSKAGVCIDGSSSGSYEIDPSNEPYTFQDADGNDISDDASPAEMCEASNEGRWVVRDDVNNKAQCFIGCPAGLSFVPKTGVAVKRTSWADDEGAKEQYNRSCISCENPYDFAPQDSSDCAKCGLGTYTTQVWRETKICSHPCPDGQLKVSVWNAEAHGFGVNGYVCQSKPSTREDYIIPKEQEWQNICKDKWGWKTHLNGQWCIKPCEANEFMKAVIWGANWSTASACYSCNHPYPVQIAKISDFSSESELAALKKMCTDCGRKIEETENGYVVCKASGDPCPENHFLNTKNECVSCDKTSAAVVDGTASGCETKCKDADGNPTHWIVREQAWNEIKCLKKCPDNTFPDWSGNCISCDTEGSVRISDISMSQKLPQLDEECKACTIKIGDVTVSRKLIRSGETYCVYEACKKDQILNNKGECIDCNSETVSVYAATTASTCNECPFYSNTNQGRAFFAGGDNSNRTCVVINPGVSGTCNSLGDSSGNHSYPQGDNITFLSTVDGICYSCDTTNGVETSQEQCETCPNRQYIGDVCYPFAGCTEKEEFWNSEKQNCSLCTTTETKVKTKAIDTELCNACVDKNGVKNRRAMTTYDEDGKKQTYCVKKCTADEWQDADGICKMQSALDAPTEIGLDAESKRLCVAAGGKWYDEKDTAGVERTYCSK